MRTAIAVVFALAIAGCDAPPQAGPPAASPTAPAVAAEPPATKPRNVFEWQRARLPAPNKVAAFLLEAKTNHGGEEGRLRIAASPDTFEGQPAWKVEETEEVPALLGLGTEATVETSTTWLSRDLRVLRRNEVAKSESETTTTSVTSDGTKVTKESPGRKPETVNYVNGAAKCSVGLAGTLLYLRMCPAAVIDPDVQDPWYPRVASVDPDGSLHCTDDISGQTFIELRGPNRDFVKLEQFNGGHLWRTIVAR